jgi:heat shock protein HslJ
MPGPFGATQMMCEEPIMQLEQAFLTALEGAQSYSIVLKGMTITTESGSLTFFADRFPLQGATWKLVSLGAVDNQRPPAEGTDFSATFVRDLFMPSGHMSGTTGCNDYVSVYYSDMKKILVNLPGLLANSCSDAIGEEEQAYFLGLNAAREYRILGNELEIFYDGMMLKFVGVFPPSEGAAGPLAPLDGTKWWLASIDTFLAIPGSETTAEFAINPDGQTGQISGSGGCNGYNAEITGVFTVELGAGTQLFCDTPEGIMEQENAYLAALSAANSFSLEGDSLLINTAQGVLVFTNQPPGEVQPPAETPEATQPLPPTETPTPEAVQPLPVTAIIIAPTEGQVDQAIVFDGSGSTSDVEITSYVWDFGDGVTAEGVTAEHTYTQPGVYYVTLTITNANGQTASAGIEVTIN